MKILVTGGAGYIGSKLVTKLVNLKFNVTVIDALRFSGSSLKIIRKADISFVRKTAQTPEHNDKLIGEVKKLKKLADLAEATELFRVPTLLYQGIDNQNKAFYDTEFIPGWQLDFFITQLLIIELQNPTPG